MLCQEARIKIGSRSGIFRQIRVRSVRVESGNVNKKCSISPIPALFNADKLADWSSSESLLGKQNKGQFWTQHTLKPIKRLFFQLNPWLKFAKKLPTLGKHYNAKPDSTRGPITRPKESTHHQSHQSRCSFKLLPKYLFPKRFHCMSIYSGFCEGSWLGRITAGKKDKWHPLCNTL